MAKRKKSERLPHIEVKVPMPPVKPAKVEVKVTAVDTSGPALKATVVVVKKDEPDGARSPKGDANTSW